MIMRGGRRSAPRRGRGRQRTAERLRWLLAGLIALVLLASGSACRRPPVAGTTITIDLGTRFQTLDGFGASIIGWQSQMRDYYAQRDFPKMFLDQLGASVLRVDLSPDSVPERENWQELSYEDFLLDGPGLRGATYLRVAEELSRASAGKLRVIGSVWTPPGWMKQNGLVGNGDPARNPYALSPQELGLARGEPIPETEERKLHLHGNKLRPDRYQHFAKALVEWTRLYRAHGVELFALSPQNEPRFSHWFGSAVYTPQELARVAEEIVAMFQREGEAVPRLFAPETMAHDKEINAVYLDALLASKAKPWLYAFAGHGYLDGYEKDDDPRVSGRLYELAAKHGLRVWVTEGGTGSHEWPAPLHDFAPSFLNALTIGHASLVTPWQVAGTIADTHVLTSTAGPTKKLAVASHFFRFLRPGMQRVQATASHERLSVVAFESAETSQAARRRVVLVVLNQSRMQERVFLRAARGAEPKVVSSVVTTKTADLQASDGQLVPPESIATFVLELAR